MKRMSVIGRLLQRSIGRRGASLIIFSLIFGFYGVLLTMSNVPVSDPPRTLAVILSIAPMETWGVAWIGASVLAFIQAFGRTRDSAWAFGTLTFVSGVWAAGYLAGWIVMEPPRDPRGWLSGALWVAVFSLTIIHAGWHEPTDSLGDEESADQGTP